MLLKSLSRIEPQPLVCHPVLVAELIFLIFMGREGEKLIFADLKCSLSYV